MPTDEELQEIITLLDNAPIPTHGRLYADENGWHEIPDPVDVDGASTP